MKNSDRHLSWENFDAMIRHGVPAIHRVSGDPVVDMFIEESERRIGLRTPCTKETQAPVSPLEMVEIDLVWVDRLLLQVSTGERRLYAEFYSFCMSLADRIQLDHEPAVQAVLTTLANWRDLLTPTGGLPLERQIGLIGELWLLARLTTAQGPGAVIAWTGPLGEPHDFRLKEVEFEVKATLAPTRTHIINGEHQLMPSPGNRLWILSLQLEPAGTGGISLPELIAALRIKAASHPSVLERLELAMAACGYRDIDRTKYEDRWRFRARPEIVPVNDACPRITRTVLDSSMPAVAHRISDLHYRVNLEGLGLPDSSAEFQDILPIGQGELDIRD